MSKSPAGGRRDATRAGHAAIGAAGVRVLAAAVILLALVASAAYLRWRLTHRTTPSKRLVCRAHLHAIGSASRFYATNHPGEGIPPLDLLVEDGSLSPQQLICPASGLETTNYVQVSYAPGAEVGDQAVVLYEPQSNHNGEGGNILFADGNTTFAVGDEYDRLINALPAQGP